MQILKNVIASLGCAVVLMVPVLSHAQDETVALPVQPIEVPAVQPFTKAEIRQGMQDMQQRLNQRIEAWGKTLTRQDFEMSIRGRILNQQKRREVCGIFQNLVNETYTLTVQNQQRLKPEDRELLKDRNAFIQALGYENNIVDTQMGFNCRLK